MQVSNIYATRLCLSGVESRRLLDTFRDFKVKHIQVSFYYLRKVFQDPLEFEAYAKNFETVIIDSGTVYGNVKNEDQKKELLSDYASYLAALNKKVYTAAVYEEGHGIDKLLPDDALIYPLDDIRGVFDNDLGALFSNIKYVGISNKECMAKGGENLVPIFAQASKRGAYIHAFGTSSRKILSKYPFYSANSSSWRSGSRYLNTYIYEGPGRGLRLYQPSDKKDPIKTEKEVKVIRRRQSNLVKVRHPDIYPLINWEEAYEGDSWEVDKGNLAQWLLYQSDLELLGHNKYFLSEKERQDLNIRKQELIGKSSHGGISERREDRDETQEKRDDRETARKEGADSQGEISFGGDTKEEKDREEAGDIEEGDVIEEYIEGTYVEELPGTELSETTGMPTPAYIQGISPDITNTAPPLERLTPVDERMRQVRNCDFCILAGRCPKYEPGAACAFGLSPENPTYDHNQIERHIMEDRADLLAIQKDRIMQLFLEEKMDASGANKDLTTNIKLYAELVQLFAEASDTRDELSIKAKGTGIMDMFKKR